MWFALLSLAFAADSVGVLYAGDPVIAAEAAAAVTDRERTSVVPVRLVDLRDGAGPRVIGGALVPACMGPPVNNNTIREQVSRGEALYNAAEFDRGLAEARAATGGLWCLSEAAEASLAARAFVLLGVLQLELKNEAAARESFAVAAQFQPSGPAFDGRFRSSHRAVLDSVTAEVSSAPPARMRIGPGGSAGLWIDGRAPSGADELTLSRGRHLVQLLQPGVVSLVIEVGSGEVVDLVRPSSLTEGHVRLAADAAWQPWFSSALAGTGVELVWTENTLWKVAEGWTSESYALKRVPSGARWAGALTGAGATATAIGGFGLVGGAILSKNNLNSPDGETREAEARRLARFGAGEMLMRVGGVSLGLGGALLIPGVVLVVKTW